MLKSLRIILFASLTVMVATGTTGSRPLSRARFQDMGVVAPSADDPLSVMTYNVRGLPWPIAWGRADALAQIGDLADTGPEGRTSARLVPSTSDAREVALEEDAWTNWSRRSEAAVELPSQAERLVVPIAMRPPTR